MFKHKYLDKEQIYSEEGIFSGIANAFTSIRDGFQLNWQYNYYKPNELEKTLNKTWLDSEWLRRRKFVPANKKLVVPFGSILNDKETLAELIDSAGECQREATNYIRWFKAEFSVELEFANWIMNSQWVKRNFAQDVHRFDDRLSSRYNKGDLPVFKSSQYFIDMTTDYVMPPENIYEFKEDTLILLDYIKMVNPALWQVQKEEEIFNEWHDGIYEHYKNVIKNAFTATEVIKYDDGSSKVVEKMVYHEEYAILMNCLKRFNNFVEAFKGDNGCDGLKNAINLREAMYRRLRLSIIK